jgi:hypothetical protein
LKFILAYLFEGKKQTREITWLRNSLYLFLLYKVFVYFYQFATFFSEDRLIYSKAKHINLIIDGVFFLNNHYAVWLASAFIILIAVLAIIGLSGRSNFVSNIFLWWLIMNIANFLYPTLTAGDFLLNQLLLFNCFFSFRQHKIPFVNDLKTALHNSALIAIKLQICVAYFLSAYYKLTDDSWINGGALHTIFQIPEFSNALLASIPSIVCMALTYLTMAYQLSFPVLVWFRPFKIWLLLFGILQHLLIALGMGLFQFGVIMIICYILFLKYDDGSEKENKMFNN